MFQLTLTCPSDPSSRLRSSSWKRLACAINADVTSQPLHYYLLRRFGYFLPHRLPRNFGRGGKQDFYADAVIAENLSYYTLTKVAHIKIEWVDAFSLHLEFDERTEVLKVFRFPSFCAMLCIRRDSNSTVFSKSVQTPTQNATGRTTFYNFNRIFRTTNGTEADDEDNSSDSEYSPNAWRRSSAATITPEPLPLDFFLEVLFSYRLLFGQHPRSYSSFPSIRFNPRKVRTGGPLLSQLCGRSCLNHEIFTIIDAPKSKVCIAYLRTFPC